MARTLHTRLDDETDRALKYLEKTSAEKPGVVLRRLIREACMKELERMPRVLVAPTQSPGDFEARRQVQSERMMVAPE